MNGSLGVFKQSGRTSTFYGDFRIHAIGLNTRHTQTTTNGHHQTSRNKASSTAWVWGIDAYPAATLKTREAG